MLRKVYLIILALFFGTAFVSAQTYRAFTNQGLVDSKDSLRIQVFIESLTGLPDTLGASNFWFDVDTNALDFRFTRLDRTGAIFDDANNAGAYQPITAAVNATLGIIGINVVKELAGSDGTQITLAPQLVGTLVIPIKGAVGKCDSSSLDWRSVVPVGSILQYDNTPLPGLTKAQPNIFLLRDSIGASIAPGVVGPTDTVCAGDSIPIAIKIVGEADTVNGDYTVVMNPGAVVFNNVRATDTLNMPPRAPGTYNDYMVVSITDSNGCTELDVTHFPLTATLTVKAIPVISIFPQSGDPGPYCWNEVVTFEVSPVLPADTTRWSHFAANGNLLPLTDQIGSPSTANYTFINNFSGQDTLFVELVDENGCTTGDTLEIEVRDPRLVNNVSDSSGNCGGLREAIVYANANPGNDTITFDIPGAGPHLISPISALPQLTDNGTLVDGWSEPDFVTPDPVVRIDGGAAGPANGISITGNSIQIRGLSVTGWTGTSPNGYGIEVQGGSNSWIYGNYVGLNVDGTTVNTNNLGAIFIGPTAGTGNILGTNADGTSDIAERNVIAQSASFGGGIRVRANLSIIKGNYIGVDKNGLLATGGSSNTGIFLGNNATGCVIGDSINNGENVISGNAGDGIVFNAANDNYVVRNFIGVGADGISPVPNGGTGISFVNPGALDNKIGSFSPAAKNIIAFNGANGIECTNATAADNLWRQNLIYSNTLQGISITAGQESVEVPEIDSLRASDTTLFGTSAPSAIVHIYADSVDEGQQFLVRTTANGSGNWSTPINIPSIGPGLGFLTAIQDSSSSSSEFSAPFELCVPVSISYINGSNSDLNGTTDSIEICDGESFTVWADSAVIDPTANVIYEWDTDLGFGSATNNAALTVSPSVPTTYYLRVSRVGQPTCFAIDSVRVHVHPLPTVSINEISTGPYCENDTVELSTNSVPAAVGYQWLQNGVPIAGEISATLFTTDVGTFVYNVVDTTAAGCFDTLQPVGLTITINQNPVVSITEGSPLAFCRTGGNQVLNGTILPGGTGTWSQTSPNGSLQAPFVATSITYDPSLEVDGFIDTVFYSYTDGNTCSDSDTSILTITGALTVNKTVDDNTCGTLRLAIREANLGLGDTVSFNIPGPGPHLLTVDSALPSITSANTLLDGWSEPDYGFDGIPEVQVNGGGGAYPGLTLDANGVTIRGLSITNFVGGNAGIQTLTGSNDSIYGNYIGITPAGAPGGNSEGIYLPGTGGHIIGDSLVFRKNIISSNSVDGIRVQSSGNYFIRNWIGVGVDSISQRANGNHGINFSNTSADNNVVGNFGPSFKNIIAFNGAAGVNVQSNNAHDNIWRKNSIYSNGTGGIVIVGIGQGAVPQPRIDSLGIDSILYGKAHAGATVHIYADGNVQGRQYLGNVVAGGGTWNFNIDPSIIQAGLDSLTAIQDSLGNSSAFADPVLVCFEPVISYVNPPTNDSIIACAGIDTVVWADSMTIDPTLTFSYRWDTISPGGGLVTTNAALSIGNLRPQTYYLTVTRSPGCVSYDSIFVDTLPSASMADAGVDFDSCDVTLIGMSANTPLFGTGTWTQLSGPVAVVNSPNDPNSTITIPSPTSDTVFYQFEWMISSLCDTTRDTVDVTIFDSPQVPMAGVDFDSCGSTAFLSGNTITTGLGHWTASGPSTLLFLGMDTTNPNVRIDIAGFVGSSDTFQVVWNSINGSCPALNDSVQVVFHDTPTPPMAGPDIDTCSNNAVMAGNPIAIGTGAWAFISGTSTVTIATPNDPNTEISLDVFTGFSDSVLVEWTSTNGSCPVDADTLQIKYNQAPTPPMAGPDIDTCSNNAVMAGNPIAIGTGAWAFISGTSTVTIATPNDPNTEISLDVFTGFSDSVLVEWTSTNGSCPVDADTLQIKYNQAPTPPMAGPDIDTCGNNAVMAGNAITLGTGSWAFISGTSTVTIATPGDPTTDVTLDVFTGIADSVLLEWTSTNGSCPVDADTLQIKYNQAPTPPMAGPDIDTCSNNAVMAGNPIAIGTGAWAFISGTSTVTIATPNDPNTEISLDVFTGFSDSVLVEWTSTNGSCPVDADTLQIKYNQAPTPPMAGPDIDTCSNNAVMAGNPIAIGTGAWAFISGTSTVTIATPNDPNTEISLDVFTGFSDSVLVEWTSTNGSCPVDADTLQIKYNQAPTPPMAGPDIDTCGNNAVMAGNAITLGTGSWAFISGTSTVTIATPGDPTTDVTLDVFTGIADSVLLEWTSTNGSCPVDADTLQIKYNQAPTPPMAGPDIDTCSNNAVMAGNPIAIGTGAWAFISGTSTVTIATPNDPNTEISLDVFTGFSDSVLVEWTSTNGSCPVDADTLQIKYNQDPTVAAAGSDIDSCNNSVVMSANPITIGIGYWSFVSGTSTVTVADTSDEATIITLDAFTGDSDTILMAWNSENGTCLPTSDLVQIIYHQNPTIANAGTPNPDTICGLGYRMSANVPAVGTGQWNTLSGPGALVYENGGTLANDSVTATLQGSYELEWTISNGNCVISRDTLTLVFYDIPPTADAGGDDSVCATPPTYTFGAVDAPGFTTYWTKISGPGTAIWGGNDSTSFFANVTVSQFGIYEFSWNIENGNCPLEADTIQIIFYEDPTPAVAGPNPLDSACGLSYGMLADTVLVGQGLWTSAAGNPGTANFSNDSTNENAIVNVDAFGVYKFYWTTTNGGVCPPSIDSVNIHFFDTPDDPNAGFDQQVCDTFVTLSGNAILLGQGTWSEVSPGGRVSFADPNDPTTTASVSLGVAEDSLVVRLYWTTVNGPCPPEIDSVDITYYNDPTDPVAGPDQAVCDTVVTLAGNAITLGQGTWIELSPGGRVTFGDVNLENTTASVVLGLAEDSLQVELLWRSATVGCPTEEDTVVITYYNDPTDPIAGPDQAVCDTVVTLAGNAITAGQGTWSEVSPGGRVSFADPNDPTTTASVSLGAAEDSLVVRLYWTSATVGCTPEIDSVDITYYNDPTDPIAGPDQAVCDTVVTLAGNAITAGQGTWSEVSPGGRVTFADPNDPTTTASVSLGAAEDSLVVRLYWTSATVGCTPEIDSVDITYYNDPTDPIAGPDQAVCDTVVTLAGNAITAGQGTWSEVSPGGRVSFADPNDPTTTASVSLGAAEDSLVVRLYWTSATVGCTPEIDSVDITYYNDPTDPIAGPDQAVCDTVVTLAGNAITAGQGTWSEVSPGGRVSFADPNDPTTTASVSLGAAEDSLVVRLYWTSATVGCTPEIDSVDITYYNDPTDPIAGPDQAVCDTVVTLAGNAITAGQGTWSEVSPGGRVTFADPNDPTTTASVSLGAAEDSLVVRLYWTSATVGCTPEIDSVDITYYNDPTDPIAGPDQAVCDTVVTLAGNAITAGQGTWSEVSPGGRVTFADPNDPTTTASVSLGAAEDSLVVRLYWTSATVGCTPEIDSVDITYYNDPTDPIAGPDQAVCDTVVTLAGNAITAGQGTWSEVSPGGRVSFADPNDPTTTASVSLGAAEDSLVVRLYWTSATVGCTPEIDSVDITYYNDPTDPIAGPDQAVCDTVVTLAGNAITAGQGTWSEVSPGGRVTFADPNDPTTTASVSLGAAEDSLVVRLYWTSATVGCTPEIDSVDITYYNDPTDPIAGPDQAVCDTVVTLAGNAITAGQGTWSEVSPGGRVSFADPNDPTTTASVSLGAAEDSLVVRLYWTSATVGCTPEIDSVDITYYNDPTDPIAGPDQAVCDTVVTLAGNAITAGQGTWSEVSPGGRVSFADPNDPTTTASVSLGAAEDSLVVRLYWTSATVGCTPEIDSVDITYYNNPSIPEAGLTMSACELVDTMDADIPTIGVGTWTSTDPLTWDDPNDPKSRVTAGTYSTPPNHFEAFWTVSNGNCPSLVDSVTMAFWQTPTVANAGSTVRVCSDTAQLNGNVPTVGTEGWFLFSGPGLVSFIPANNIPNPQAAVTVRGSYVFEYTISNGACPVSRDTVTVIYDPDPTAPLAGPDQFVCNDSTTLAGNSITSGIGIWSVANGAAVNFDDVNNENTGINVVFGPTQDSIFAVILWTSSNGVCPPETDTVEVTFYNDPDAATAGADQTICALATTLAGNNPNVGVGTWTEIGSTRLVFSNINDPASTATVTPIGVTEDSVVVDIEWAISNGNCVTTRDTVTIAFYNPNLVVAAAGTPQNVCTDSVMMGGNDVTVGVGQSVWTLVSGPLGGMVTFGDSSVHNTIAKVDSFGTYTFRWTISNGPVCPSNFSDVTHTFFDPIDSAVLSGGGVICEGDSIPLVVTVYGGSGPFFVTVTADVAGNNPSFPPGTYNSGDTLWHIPADPSFTSYTLINVQEAGGNNCTANLLNSGLVTSLVNPTVAASMSPLLDSMCFGSQDTLNVNFSVGTGPFYVRYTDGTSNFVEFPYTNGDDIIVTPTVNTTYYIDSISDANGCGVAAPSPNITDSAVIEVNPIAPPTVLLNQNPNGALCVGETVFFTTTSTNTGNSPSWSWTVNGGPIVSTVDSFSYTPADGDIVRVTLDVTGMGCVSAPAGIVMDSAIMNVFAAVTPVVTIDQNPLNPVCNDDTISFVANVTGAGPSDSYAWYVNGANQGVNNDSITIIRTWTDGDVVRVILTSSAACATVGADTADQIINVTPGGAPSVSIVQSPGSPTCDGDVVRFEATPIGGGSSPIFDWLIDGVSQGVDSTVFETSLLAAGSPYNVSVQMTSSASCFVPSNTADTVIVTVATAVSPSVSISATPNGPVCPGSNIDFEAILVGEGSSPSIEWYVNGILQGFGTMFTYGPSSDGDSVSVEMTSNASCAIGGTVTDAYIIEEQNPVIPSVTLSQSPTNPICNGDDVQFTANAMGGGTAPNYEWLLNGVTQAQGVNLDVVTINNLVDGDEVVVILTGNNTCSVNNTDSDTIVIQGQASVPLFVSINQSPAGDLCLNQAVTYTATITGGGANPSYQWNVVPPGGAPISNLDELTLTTSAAPANPFEIGIGTNLITLNITADPGSCNAGSSFLAFQSTEVSAVVEPEVTLAQSPSNPVCAGENVTFSTTVNGEGTSPQYNWFINGVLDATNSTGIYNSNTLADGDEVVVELVSNGCGTTPTAYDTLVIDLQTPIVPTVSIEVTPGEVICSGDAVRLVALATGEGDNPSFQWEEDGIFFGNGDTIIRTFTDPGGGDSILVTISLNKNLACGGGPVTAVDSIYIKFTSAPSVSIVQDPDPTCIGDLTNLVADVEGLGFGSQYVWRDRTGIPDTIAAGADLTNIQFTPLGVSYDLIVTNTSSSCIPNSAASAPITIQTAVLVTPSVRIDMDPENPICSEEQLIFTPDSVEGQGANPTYNWYVNGVLTHIGATYNTTELVDFDSLSLELISSASCALVPSATDFMIIREIDSTVSITGDTLFCYGLDSVLLVSNDSSPASMYTWIEALSGDTVGFDDSIYVDTTGNYYVVVDNNRGCPESSRQITVVANLPYTDSIMAAVPDTCFGETITLSLTGTAAGYDVNWMYGLTDTIPGANDSIYEAPWTGAYYAIVANDTFCVDTIGVATVTIKPEIDRLLSIATGDSILCKDDTALIWVPSVQGNTAAGATGIVTTGVAGQAGTGARTVEAWVQDRKQYWYCRMG